MPLPVTSAMQTARRPCRRWIRKTSKKSPPTSRAGSYWVATS